MLNELHMYSAFQPHRTKHFFALPLIHTTHTDGDRAARRRPGHREQFWVSAQGHFNMWTEGAGDLTVNVCDEWKSCSTS